MIIIDLLPFSLSNVNTIVLTVLNELTPPNPEGSPHLFTGTLPHLSL